MINKTNSIKLRGGFSLVELMVSISIFMVITSITLVNYPKFSNKLSLDLLAEDVALSLRQAQIYGSSVLGAKSGTAKAFGAYGVHFDDPASLTSEYDYMIFADVSNARSTRQYDGLPITDPNLICPLATGATMGAECLQIFKITGFNRVRELCLGFDDEPNADQRVTRCDSDPQKRIGSLDVVFIRPNLDAKFAIKTPLGVDIDTTNISNVGIVLESAGGDYTKTVVVWKTGQISVE